MDFSASIAWGVGVRGYCLTRIPLQPGARTTANPGHQSRKGELREKGDENRRVKVDFSASIVGVEDIV